MPPTIVVVGHGMVGHRFLEAAVERGLHETHQIVVLSEERRPAYDRVHLSSFFDGVTAKELALAEGGWFADHGIELALGEPATELDTEAKVVTTRSEEHTSELQSLMRSSYAVLCLKKKKQ